MFGRNFNENKNKNEKLCLKLLNKIKRNLSKEKIEVILLLLLSINSKLNYEDIILWLKQYKNENEARKLIKSILINHRGPFSFLLDSYIGWMIVITKTDENTTTEEIIKVPYLISNNNSNNNLVIEKESTTSLLINADIRVGDEINILRFPKMWFIVHEIRPESNSILVITKSDFQKCKLKGREYKEIYCLSLIGCTVRRTGQIRCKYHYPNSCFCQSNDNNHINNSRLQNNNINQKNQKNSNNSNNNNNSNRNNNNNIIIFQFPKPDVDTALESLATIVHEESESFGAYHDLDNGNGNDDYNYLNNNVENDHIIKMQRSSYVEAWLQKKQNLILGQKYLNHIHSTLSLSRIHWLAVGRALRVISLGKRDLLDSWKNWSYSCPSFNESEETINSLWLQFRPPTNADHPDIVRARNYLQERKEVLIKRYEQQGNNYNENITVNIYEDPLARTILDDAHFVLNNMHLEYWTENMISTNSTNSTNSTITNSIPKVNIQPLSVVVPSVKYSFHINSFNETMLTSNQRYQPYGNFEEMNTCDAIISSGNLISITDNGYNYPHSCQVPQQWYYVHKVDLLFTRILVSKCFTPPIPWILSQDNQLNEIKHWIEVSRLWHVLVCSILPETNLSKNKINYQVFVVPIPDPNAAIKMLKRLSERSPSSELGLAHANHLLQKSKKSSQHNFNQPSLIQLDVLETTSSTITLCWCCSGDTDYFLTNNNRFNNNNIDNNDNNIDNDNDGNYHITPNVSNVRRSNDVIREDIGPVKISIRISKEQILSEWEDVYCGLGRGCMIEKLKPNSLYHIRLLPLQKISTNDIQRSIRGPVYISARTEELTS